jgi:16S rRNA (guanine(527)-N(7))-methyltransferase RsmG
MNPEPAQRLVDKVFEWVGIQPAAGTFDRLETFSHFLVGEAVQSGGIGPTEAQRVWARHICDSLTFLCAITGPRSSVTATAVVDVGSGVGLPGIPLAAALPHVEFTLLDRSERRCRLARRAARMMELANVEVLQVDAARHHQACDAVVSRASLRPDRFVEIAARLTDGPAIGVVAGSHGGSAPTPPPGCRVIEVPGDVLGEAVWLIEVSLSGRSAG